MENQQLGEGLQLLAADMHLEMSVIQRDQQRMERTHQRPYPCSKCAGLND